MITIHAELTTEQKKPIAKPAFALSISDRYIGVPRRRWTLLTTDAVNDGHTQLRTAYDNAFVRARIDSTTGKVYTQRITDPTVAGQWTAWTEVATSSPYHPIALATDGQAIIALAYVDPSTYQTIYMIHSHDNGATWSAPETVAATGAGFHITWIALSLNAGSGDIVCFLSERNDATNDDILYYHQPPRERRRLEYPCHLGKARPERDGRPLCERVWLPFFGDPCIRQRTAPL